MKNFLKQSFFLLILTILLAIVLSKGIAQLMGKSLDIKTFSPLSDITVKKETNSKPDFIKNIPQTEDSEKKSQLKPDKSEASNDTILSQRETQLKEIQKLSTIPSGITDFSEKGTWGQEVIKTLEHAKADAMRIAFLGDSFIEGDILVAPFRNILQKQYGGSGVGFVPMTSVVSRFRTSVKHRFGGEWKVFTAAKNHKRAYTLSEMCFEVEGKAWAEFSCTNLYTSLIKVEQVGLMYSTKHDDIAVNYSCNDEAEKTLLLPGTQGNAGIVYIPGSTPIKKVKMSFTSDTTSQYIGVLMENRNGVSVDNFSARGYSGATIAGVNSKLCTSLQRIRPYKLIILSYGLNVVDPNTPNASYNGYIKQMSSVIRHLKSIYPNVPILIMSVSQRLERSDDGGFQILPGVVTLLKKQFKLAEEEECLFWNTYDAMEQIGGMELLVEQGIAAKDYTHISYKAGAMMAKRLVNDLLKPRNIIKEESNE